MQGGEGGGGSGGGVKRTGEEGGWALKRQLSLSRRADRLLVPSRSLSDCPLGNIFPVKQHDILV